MLFSERSHRFQPILGVQFLAATLGLLGLLLLSLTWGDYPASLAEVVAGILRVADNPDLEFLVWSLRLPRAMVALLVGAALATSGAILQRLTRNPLAAPEIIGVNGGAALVAVAVIVVLPTFPTPLLPVAALIGGLAAVSLTYLLAWNGGTTPVRLVLVGAAITAATTALTNVALTFGSIYSVSQAMVWLTGSVYGRGWQDAATLAPWLAVGLPLALLLAGELDVLALGDGTARGLGSQIERSRFLLLLLATALAAAAVSVAGNVGFVGLASPHLARSLGGRDSQRAIALSAWVGAGLVLLADTLARLAPLELPCGLVTALLGAPYFLFLLSRKREW
jgi:iron complex transport system permease protein